MFYRIFSPDLFEERMTIWQPWHIKLKKFLLIESYSVNPIILNYLSWWCSCLLSAEKWESHTALSRTNLVLEEFAEGRPLLALLSLLWVYFYPLLKLPIMMIKKSEPIPWLIWLQLDLLIAFLTYAFKISNPTEMNHSFTLNFYPCRLTPMTEALCLSLLKPSRQTITRGLRRSENTGEVVPLAPNPQPRLLRSRRPRQRKPPWRLRLYSM